MVTTLCKLLARHDTWQLFKAVLRNVEIKNLTAVWVCRIHPRSITTIFTNALAYSHAALRLQSLLQGLHSCPRSWYVSISLEYGWQPQEMSSTIIYRYRYIFWSDVFVRATSYRALGSDKHTATARQSTSRIVRQDLQRLAMLMAN